MAIANCSNLRAGSRGRSYSYQDRKRGGSGGTQPLIESSVGTGEETKFSSKENVWKSDEIRIRVVVGEESHLGQAGTHFVICLAACSLR